MQQAASFQFIGALNDFLRPGVRGKEVSYAFRGEPAVKDAIEAQGVPHPEVHVILVNDIPANFMTPLKEGDKVKVYPFTRSSHWPEGHILSRMYSGPSRFILDVHLGSLAKSLRMLGLDCYYERDLTDGQIANIAYEEQRIVLTRDVGLLKQKIIERGYWLRSQQIMEQLDEVIQRYNLPEELDPLSRCLVCNTIFEQVEKKDVEHLLPPQTRLYFEEFYKCPSCSKIYWKGSHYERMLEHITQVKQKNKAEQ